MIRGNLVSKSIDQNYQEAVHLAQHGVKELICVSQDTSSYGYDFDRSASNLKQNYHLIRLLDSLSNIDGIEWIRVMYLYPSLFSDELIECIAQNPKICKYIDMPVQHISDAMLKTMRRNTSKNRQWIFYIKSEPHSRTGSRTSMIVGYPGETEKDFGELCDFVEEFRFDRLGVFVYSREEGTHAYDLKKQIPDKLKKERFNHLMTLQQTISLDKNNNKINKNFRVIIDVKDGNRYVGRTSYDAPEIDNEVIIETDRNLEIGSFIDVHITDATEYDLIGKPI